MKFSTLPLRALALAILLPAVAVAQSNPDYVLSASSAPMAVSGDVNVRIDITLDTINGGAVDAWSYGLCHDGAELTLGGAGMASPTQNEVMNLQEFATGMTPAGNTSGGATPVLFPAFATDAVFDDGAGGAQDGFTSAVVIDFLLMNTLPPTANALINIAFYEVVGSSGSLDFCNVLGAVPVSIDVIVAQVPVAPTVMGGSIGSSGPSTATFLRGECNQVDDLDLADGIFLLRSINGLGPAPDCADSCDFNADGSLTLSDAIDSFAYLFTSGAAPGAPFPGCADTALAVDPMCTFDGALCP